MIVLYSFIVLSIQAQEVLKPAISNNILAALPKSNIKNHPRTRAITTPLSLPFIDDFSYEGPFPDSTKWINNLVFVNNTLGYNPPTWGVATFDGLNQHGQPFDTSGILVQGGGDTLLSAPINLKGLHAADSVYLSFFYQTGGNGYSAENDDTLYLEIMSKKGNWQTVWSMAGPLYPGAPPPFKQVLIPILADTFLDSAFQFRFREWCTISGFNDVFNVDYVKLDKKRTRNDTLLNDVACQYQPSNILIHYTSMPWKQFYNFQSTELKPLVNLYLRNNKGITQSTNYRISINDITDKTSLLFSKNPTTLISRLSNFTDTFHLKKFPASSSSIIEVKTTSNIEAITADPLQRNDTCSRITRFDDYLAYDDGSAELLYGLANTGSELALKYNVNIQDTISAIAIHFQRSNTSLSSKLFSVIVWSSITPGTSKETIKYRKDYQSPKYVNWDNSFYYYILDTPQIVSGSFYVGWQQSDPDILNVGFDVNDTANSNLYFNTGSGWTQSIYPGAVMIRPVFGSKILSAGIANISPINQKGSLAVFPNPANNDKINLKISDRYFINGYSEITDVYGRKVYYGVYTPSIDIKTLAAGVYILRVYNIDTNTSMITKFVRQ